MKFAIITLSLIAALSSAFAGDYQVVSQTIKWTGKTPVKSHYGELTASTLKVAISEEGKIEKLHAVLDMNSIDVQDLSGKFRDKLTGHLASDDFFNVGEFPTSEFKLTEFVDGGLVGKITIRGIEKDITIPVTVSAQDDGSYKLEGAFSFNRFDFGVAYQSGNLLSIAKDKLIDELIDVEVMLHVAAE